MGSRSITLRLSANHRPTVIGWRVWDAGPAFCLRRPKCLWIWATVFVSCILCSSGYTLLPSFFASSVSFLHVLPFFEVPIHFVYFFPQASLSPSPCLLGSSSPPPSSFLHLSFISFPSCVPLCKKLVMWYHPFLKLSFDIPISLTFLNRQRGRLESMIRQLVPEREKIGEAMVWCIEHADAAEEICQCITEALTNTETALPKKVSLPR